MDEAAMLAAIAASSPDDQAIRLAYADWLEERGDERAEYIRLEEAARHLPVWNDGLWAARERRQTLQAACDPAWRETLGYTDGYRPLFSMPLPAEREHRWRLLLAFLATWHDWKVAPAVDGIGPDLLAIYRKRFRSRLPAALAEFHGLVGWSLRARYPAPANSVLDLQELRRDAHDTGIEFRRQPRMDSLQDWDHYWFVSTESGDEDPPVHSTDDDGWGHLPRVCPTFTGFTLTMLVVDTVLTWLHRMTADMNAWPEKSMTARSGLARCYLPTAHLANRVVTLGEGRDILMLHLADTEQLVVAARTPAAFDTLPASLRRILTAG